MDNYRIIDFYCQQSPTGGWAKREAQLPQSLTVASQKVTLMKAKSPSHAPTQRLGQITKTSL